MFAGVTSSNGTQTLVSTFSPLASFMRGIDRAAALAGSVLEHGDVEIAGLHVGERVLRGVDAADDDVLHVPTPAAFMALIAPIAMSSLLATTASNLWPAAIQLVIRSCALMRVPAGGLLVDDR